MTGKTTTLDRATLEATLALVEEALAEASAVVGGRKRRTYSAGLASGRVTGLGEAVAVLRGQLLALEIASPETPQGAQEKPKRKSRAAKREHAPGTVGTDRNSYAKLRGAFFIAFRQWHSKSSTTTEVADEEMRRWALYQRWWGVHHLSEVPLSCLEASHRRLLNMSPTDLMFEYGEATKSEEKGLWL